MDATFPNCPRCGTPMEFGEGTKGVGFRRECWCVGCKIAGVGDTDNSAWECVVHFDPKCPNPETDAASYETGFVPVAFARKLERERDALRNLLTIALQHGLTDQVRAEAENLLKP